MNVYIIAFGDSEGAKLLADEIGAVCAWRSSELKQAPCLIVNWGCSSFGESLQSRIIGSPPWNHPSCVAVAINKLTTLRRLDGKVRITPYTDSQAQALTWLQEGHRTVIRSELRGSGGYGISIASPGCDVPEAPLYTQFVESTHEYRVHVFGDAAILCQLKEPRAARYNNQIRTSKNGWRYSVVDTPEDVRAQACKAVRALGLSFGAVDILWDGQAAYVLEVNTAPGLTSPSVTAYAQAIGNLLTRRAI